MSWRAKEYFHCITKPTVADFLAAPWDIRRGVLAALVLNHMADHVALQGSERATRKIRDKKLDDLRKTLVDRCPDFSFIRDVADATKHAKLDRKDVVVSASEQISSTPGLFNAPFGKGVFREAARVVVILDDGRSRELETAIRSVTAMWESYLVE